MTDLDSILSALADALELERELGARSVDIDRALLVVDAASSPRREGVRRETRDARPAEGVRRETRDERPAEGVRQETRDAKAKIVFLHDRALSPKGVEMMAKIVTAMKFTPETAPILFTGTRPPARAYVVLGHNALRKWFPGQAGAPGQWITPNGEANVLVTYSPEYILRFGTVTAAVKKLKMDMWTSLKSVLQRINC